MSVLGYCRKVRNLRHRSKPRAPVCLLAAMAAGAVCGTEPTITPALAQTLPVPPYQTQGAYRVECQQDDELVLVIEPAYRAWVDRGRIRGWQFVTADGIPIQGRIGTNVNCRYDLLPANAYPLTAFVNPDAGPVAPPVDTGADTGAGNAADDTDPVVTRRLADLIEVTPLPPPEDVASAPPETADPAPDPFTERPPAARAVEITSVAPTISFPPIGRPPVWPTVEPARPEPPPAEPVVEAPVVEELPSAPPAAGAYWVQLGAFETEADGHLAWAQLLNAAGWSDLAALQPVMQRVSPAPGRVLHRLRVDVRTQDRARVLCTIQQTAGGECLMVGPGLTPDAWIAEIARPAAATDAPVDQASVTDGPITASQTAPDWSLP